MIPSDGVRVRGIEVVARGNEDPNRLIRRFTKAVRNSGVLQELYDRRSYQKPSEKRRRKSSRARFARSLEEKA